MLNYLGRAVQLNLKRGGTHVDPATVASDGYMINLQAVLSRFAEPFLDATFTKASRLSNIIEGSHAQYLVRVAGSCGSTVLQPFKATGYQ